MKWRLRQAATEHGLEYTLKWFYCLFHSSSNSSPSTSFPIPVHRFLPQTLALPVRSLQRLWSDASLLRHSTLPFVRNASSSSVHVLSQTHPPLLLNLCLLGILLQANASWPSSSCHFFRVFFVKPFLSSLRQQRIYHSWPCSCSGSPLIRQEKSQSSLSIFSSSFVCFMLT